MEDALRKREKAKKAVKAKASGLGSWIAETGRGPQWGALPKEAREEIQQVIDHNDANPTKTISQPALLKRFKTVYNVTITRSSLDSYLQAHLGRRWRKDTNDC